MLASGGQSAKMPAHPEWTNCFQERWIDYDLNYSGDSFGAVLEELESDRDGCDGFIKYEPGSNPQQHLETKEQLRRENVQWRTAKLSFLGALIGALIGSVLPKLMSWLAGAPLNR
jgi:hypothetical protein